MNGDYGQMTGDETAYTVLNNTTCQQDIIINQVNNKECLLFRWSIKRFG